MKTSKFIAYYRVFTQRQAQSGLGLAAQHNAVIEWLNRSERVLLGEYTDISSGRKNDRQELMRALEHCKESGATLLIARLDRLSRNAAFLMGLRDSGVEFVACDMPQANRLTVGIMALMAEHEAEVISSSTKAALAAAKARGQILGGFRGSKVDPSAGTAARQRKANEYVQGLAHIIEPLAGEGVSAVARAMNERGVLTPSGGSQWTPTTAHRVVERLCKLKLDARHGL